MAATLRDELALDGTGRLIDLGCGPGSVALLLAPLFAEVVGVDIATNLLAQAENRAKTEGVNAHFQEGDAEHLPFGDGEFDVVQRPVHERRVFSCQRKHRRVLTSSAAQI